MSIDRLRVEQHPLVQCGDCDFKYQGPSASLEARLHVRETKHYVEQIQKTVTQYWWDE